MSAQVEIADQESFTDLGNGEIFDSHPQNADSTILLREGSREYYVIKNCFLFGMGPLTRETTIVTVRKITTESITTQAKIAAFKVFSEAMARKNGGDANVKFGWYSGSKEEIDGIVSYGFSSREIKKFENDNTSHGVGIHLFHHRYSLAASLVGEEDEEGLKHVLLCRLILGKQEQIISGSKQSYPSSTQFDSGVDNLENPRKYVIWSSSMNSYILPSHVVSFRPPRLRGFVRARSPCVHFTVLLSTLSKSLDSPRMNMIFTTYHDFRKGKVRREQLVRKIREVVGDDLLLKIIKHHHKEKA